MDSLGDVRCMRIMVLLRRDTGFEQMAFSSILCHQRNWEHFRLSLNNQQSYGQMEATAEFSAANRFGNTRIVSLIVGW